MNIRSLNVLFRVILVSVILQYALSVDTVEEDKVQGFIPLTAHGQDVDVALIAHRGIGGDMIHHPRMGSYVIGMPKTLIPYPRAGREILESLNGMYDLLVPEYFLPEPDASWATIRLGSIPVEESESRVTIIPRFGRKKRSIDEDQNEQQDASNLVDHGIMHLEPHQNVWKALKELDEDSFLRENRQNARSRYGFVPRVGKKSSDNEFLYEMKRKMLFTPRIGRASLVPRIGRNDSRFQVKSRGSFIPRIGRRASAFVPRIGRSEKSHNKDTD